MSVQSQTANPIKAIQGFRKDHKLTYPILSDEKAVIIQKFGFSGIPQDVIIDRNGKYIAAPQEVSALVRKLNSMLKSKVAVK